MANQSAPLFNYEPDSLTALAGVLGLPAHQTPQGIRDAVIRLIGQAQGIASESVSGPVSEAILVLSEAVRPKKGFLDFGDMNPVLRQGKSLGIGDLEAAVRKLQSVATPQLQGTLPGLAEGFISGGTSGPISHADPRQIDVVQRAHHFERDIRETEVAIAFLRQHKLIPPEANDQSVPVGVSRLLSKVYMGLVWNRQTSSWDPYLVSRNARRRQSLFTASLIYFDRLQQNRAQASSYTGTSVSDLRASKDELLKAAREARAIENGEALGTEGPRLRAQAHAASQKLNRSVRTFQAMRMVALYRFIRAVSEIKKSNLT